MRSVLFVCVGLCWLRWWNEDWFVSVGMFEWLVWMINQIVVEFENQQFGNVVEVMYDYIWYFWDLWMIMQILDYLVQGGVGLLVIFVDVVVCLCSCCEFEFQIQVIEFVLVVGSEGFVDVG